MSVVIAPNLVRTSQKIDSAGNVINKNGQIIDRGINDVGYIPTPEEIKKSLQPKEPTPDAEAPKASSSLSELIDKKVSEAVEKIIAQKVEEALKNL